MTPEEFSLFLQFNNAVPRMGEYSATRHSWLKDFQSQAAELDPVAADALCRQRLDDITVNESLVHLYHEIDTFQVENMGSGRLYHDARHPFAQETLTLLKKTLNVEQPTSADMETFIEIVESELEKNSRVFFLRQFLKQHADSATYHRLQKLEEVADAIREDASSPLISVSKTTAEFTQVRQALALRYLCNEVLGLTNIDSTRLITLGHLLAAKPIPRDEKTGVWKIANSGLKSAFTKSIRKEGPGYIADLQFVLRVFEPFRGQGSGAMDSAIAALQKDIDREKRKLAREKD